jgi:hypothetical protein
VLCHHNCMRGRPSVPFKLQFQTPRGETTGVVQHMGPVHKDRLGVGQAGRHSAHAQAAHNCARYQQCNTPHCSHAQAEYRRTASTDPGAKAVLIKRIHQIGGRENILRFHTYKNTGVVGAVCCLHLMVLLGCNAPSAAWRMRLLGRCGHHTSLCCRIRQGDVAGAGQQRPWHAASRVPGPARRLGGAREAAPGAAGRPVAPGPPAAAATAAAAAAAAAAADATGCRHPCAATGAAPAHAGGCPGMFQLCTCQALFCVLKAHA